MADLFGNNSNSEINTRTSNQNATHDDVWRQKEQHKLQDRNGDVTALSTDAEDSSSSSEEDEDAKELTEQVERDFFKTLSYLKKKDPRIYDEEVRFFGGSDFANISENSKTKRNKNEKPLLLRDYERKRIVERSGKLSDDEDDRSGYAAVRPTSPTLVEEQQAIKDSFKAVLQDSDDDENAWGGLFESRKKTSRELKKETDGYYEWLKGQQDDMKDENVKTDLKYLHDYWNDPKLNCDERFLRDYLLNKKFLEPEDEDRVPTYDEIVHDSDDGLLGDEATFLKQEQFERKFNFRFEEPDRDFIKRYPRLMENSLRRKDTRRKVKRDEVKKRKVAEKDRKKEELKQLKALKRKEIIDKIEKLKEMTGNANVGFEDEGIEGDFNPAEYDKRMSQVFTDEFYGEECNGVKPEFPDLDEELENWNDYEGQEVDPGTNGDYEPHCDDPNFIMDCDFNPSAKFQPETIESTKQKKKGKKSTFAQALAEKKPIFNSNDQTFDEYIDEYYGMDFEDVIGDLPCRFKYRSVIPNDFGLTIDEILRADDKELNRWCPMKKATTIRPESAERYDLKLYHRRGLNVEYKKKILCSLYNETEQLDQPEEVKKKKRKKMSKLKTGGDVLKMKTSVTQTFCQDEPSIVEGNEELLTEKKKKKSNKTKKDVSKNAPGSETEQATSSKPIDAQKVRPTSPSEKVSKKHKNHDLIDESSTGQLHKKRKMIDSVATVDGDASEILQVEVSGKKTKKKKKKKKKKKRNGKESSQNGSGDMFNSGVKGPKNAGEITRRMKKKNGGVKKRKRESEPDPFSDSRLKAYGLHPKKFKNFLKYGKTEK